MVKTLEKQEDISSLKPHRELDLVEQSIAERQINRTNAKSAREDRNAKLRELDSIEVTGKFMNLRAPGQPVKLTYLKHETDPVKWYNFNQGQIYTIPRGFADQINDHYARIIDVPSSDMGQALSGEKQRTPLYAFVPISF